MEWLADAGVVNLCYCLSYPELPLKGNYDPKLYKVYFKDTGFSDSSRSESGGRGYAFLEQIVEGGEFSGYKVWNISFEQENSKRLRPSGLQPLLYKT